MYGILDEELQLMRHIFAQTPTLERVVLYGSRVKGTNKPFSDVDITLIGDRLTNDDLTDVMFRLSESSLPYFDDVSLFKDLTNTALIEHIQRRGRTIYEA